METIVMDLHDQFERGSDKRTVEAELRRRGLDPVADTDDSFHIEDPDGFDLQIAGKKMKSAP